MITQRHYQIARSIRKLFESQIAKTWDEYFKQQRRAGAWLNAYDFAILVQEQAKMQHQSELSFEQAADITLAVCPELGGEYWEKLSLGAVEEG